MSKNSAKEVTHQLHSLDESLQHVLKSRTSLPKYTSIVGIGMSETLLPGYTHCGGLNSLDHNNTDDFHKFDSLKNEQIN
jgi:hypothetical protein